MYTYIYVYIYIYIYLKFTNYTFTLHFEHYRIFLHHYLFYCKGWLHLHFHRYFKVNHLLWYLILQSLYLVRLLTLHISHLDQLLTNPCHEYRSHNHECLSLLPHLPSLSSSIESHSSSWKVTTIFIFKKAVTRFS